MAKKPLPSAYPQVLKTIGDHLKKKRLDLRLLQREVAQRLEVDEVSIYNWENNLNTPSLCYLPKVINFLGYVPYDSTTFDRCKTLGERIAISRRFLGLSQKRLADYVGIDPSTLRRWENGKSQPLKKLLEKIDTFFTSLPSVVLRPQG